MRKSIPSVLLTAVFLASSPAAVWAKDGEETLSKGGPTEFRPLKFRSIGPFVGGRVCRSAGVPGDPLTYYIATASGGLWKSTDGGLQWKPIFDEQPAASIGSLAIAPSDPNVIYVGTGEANIRGNVAPGNGIYKSTDAGKTWKHVWPQVGQIGTMIVHPTNPDIAYAAVLGHAFGPNSERGVFRSTDGGKTWHKTLYKDPDTGASDVCLDPRNPRLVFAGLWQTRRRPWEMTSGGPGSGLYLSRDGGDTWMHLTPKETSEEHWGKGLPELPWGKIGIAIAPSDSRRVYALIEAEKGGLYRSDDGGENWKLMNGGKYLRQRAWYYSTLTIDPVNADVIWCPQVPMLKSIDGGKTFKRVKGVHHGDNHDVWIDPRLPRRIIASNDGGVDISTNGGETWYTPPLPIAQFYHIAVDNDTPYHVSGAMQDLGTAEGPSNSLSAAGISNCNWRDIGGGEAGHTAHDPTDPNIVYAGEYGGIITRYDHRSRQARNVSIYPYNPSGHGAEDLQYRFQWTAPILVSRHDPKVVYHASNVLFRTVDGGVHWTPVSRDLTRNDKSKQKWSGGPITGDNTGVEVYGTIFAVAESPMNKDTLWAGSDDGLVHVTRDGGHSWTDVTKNIPGVPEWGTVSGIDASPFDQATAYVAVDAHRLDDMRPYLFKTSDHGATWKSLAGKLPQDTHLHAVREDPKMRGLIFVGSGKGVSYTKDDGASWKELKLNFPTVPVHDLVVKNNDLVIGTHGRSVWIFDDLTPIREMSQLIANSEAHLFPVAPAIRWHYSTPFHSKGSGQNPPAGAVIHYYLKQKPKGILTLEIRDAKGVLIDSFTSKKKKEAEKAIGTQHEKVETPKALPKEEEEETPEDDPDAPEERYKRLVLTTEVGVNRIVWDLRHKGAEKIKGAKVDAGNPEVGPFVAPGKYTIKLVAEGKTMTTEVVVQPDRRVPLSPGEEAEQLKLAIAIRDDINHLTRMVNQVRTLRKQLAARNELLQGQEKMMPVVQSSNELLRKLDALEEKLHNPKAQVTYDILAQPGGAKLYSQLSPLFDFVKESDGAPTQGMRERYADYHKELEMHQQEFKSLLSGQLLQLNQLAKKLDVPTVLVTDKPQETRSP